MNLHFCGRSTDLPVGVYRRGSFCSLLPVTDTLVEIASMAYCCFASSDIVCEAMSMAMAKPVSSRRSRNSNLERVHASVPSEKMTFFQQQGKLQGFVSEYRTCGGGGWQWIYSDVDGKLYIIEHHYCHCARYLGRCSSCSSGRGFICVRNLSVPKSSF